MKENRNDTDIKKLKTMLDAEEQTDDTYNGHFIENFYKHELSRESKKVKKLVKVRK